MYVNWWLTNGFTTAWDEETKVVDLEFDIERINPFKDQVTSMWDTLVAKDK